jgi:hypothetical protein
MKPLPGRISLFAMLMAPTVTTALMRRGCVHGSNRSAFMPGTLKKRRERLGLTTKRQPGPPPNESQ